MEEENSVSIFGVALLLLIFLALLFEVGIVIYAFVNADEVNCNLLWCEFKQESSESFSIQTTEIRKSCFVNDVQVNCSEVEIPNFNELANKGGESQHDKN